MINIRLPKGQWAFDESKPLGPPGGFGAVFLGGGADGKPAAVKRIHATRQQVAARELSIAKYLLGESRPHLIPILDVGRDASIGEDFIVMAQAQQSLQDLVDESAPLAEQDALEIIDAIACGLIEIGELVHRDLKPGNILLHNGVWKISDLGLARYVEASTSAHTMKDFLSGPYAAPEQWRGERATKATDVYALGCIVYSLVTGRPPFSGQTWEDYSQMHQFESPPVLTASDRLRSLSAACLAKNQLARPSLQSIRAQILRAKQVLGSPSSSALAAVGASIAEEKAKAEAQQAFLAKSVADRITLTQDAIKNIREILQQLIELVRTEAPTAEVAQQENEKVIGVSYDIRMGQVALRAWVYPSLTEYMRRVLDALEWDVLAGILIWIQSAPFGEGWDPKILSANLWFGKLNQADGYRWWEVSYTTGAPGEAPFGLDHWWEPDDPQLRGNPRIIDGEHVDEFFDRWTNRLAKAAEQKLPGSG